jgi:hypothetical protein
MSNATLELASTELTAADLEAWDRRGFHIHGKLFSDQEIEALRTASEDISAGIYDKGVPPDGVGWRPGDDPMAVRKFDNCWKANRAVSDAVLSKKLGYIAGQLLRTSSMRMWHDQLLYKPPHGGKVVTWHQDWGYWQMIRECKTATCWIALDDVRADSGPMVFLEGSHKLGLLPQPSTISGEDEKMPRTPETAKLREVPVIIPAGHVSFHHGLTLHGSARNFSPIPRRAMVSHIMSGECTYKPGQGHHNEDYMKRQPQCPKPGERFGGPQFPLMWEKE